MKRLILALALLVCCVYDPVVTHRAAVRSHATSLLEMCLRTPPGRPFTDQRCKQESKEYCNSQGLEDACGIDGLWGRMPK